MKGLPAILGLGLSALLLVSLSCGGKDGTMAFGDSESQSDGQVTCTPYCGEKKCGPDGCGGVCGTCAANEICNPQGQCEICYPQCQDKECGDDGCGGSCGACASGLVCSVMGHCVCVPNCQNKVCGDNGCGGTCGSCPADQHCAGGVCVEGPCEGDCTGKACGDDGCGNLCGTCPADQHCENFACVPGACEPQCEGKECGDDGCGSVCAHCPYGKICENNKCVTPSGAGEVGDPCTTAADCLGGYCATDLLGVKFPGGYCMKEGCESGTCPAGSQCFTIGSNGETYCIKTCTASSECRVAEGYECDSYKTCWPTGTGPAGDSPIGGPCQTNSDCKDGGATCYPEEYQGEPTGFVNGYCMIFDCDGGSCPAGSACTQVSEDTTVCLAECSADSGCPQTAGYGCYEPGVCFPHCGSDSDCPADYFCDTANEYCVSSAHGCSPANPNGWCPGTLVCQDGECKPYDFTCTDQTYEPNETKEQAATVSAGEQTGLQICSNDNDWYQLEIPEGHIGTLGMYFNHNLGDLDLCMYTSGGTLLGCRYPHEDYPASWRGHDLHDEYLSAISKLGPKRVMLYKGDGYQGAVGDYKLDVRLIEFKDGSNCTDHYSAAECKGCNPDTGACTLGLDKVNLIQFPYPDPNGSYVGDGYVLEHASGYNWARREVIMRIRYAIHEVQQQFPGTGPLGLMDMADIEGITPGFDVDDPRHPETTHDQGGNVDVAYYQTDGNNEGAIICDAQGGSNNGYYCTTDTKHIVDLPRTAYFLAKIASTDRFRVAGIDTMIGPLLKAELQNLKNQGVITAAESSAASSSLAYDTKCKDGSAPPCECTSDSQCPSGYSCMTSYGVCDNTGWSFHHHHMHLSWLWWSQGKPSGQPVPKVGCGFRFPGDGPLEQLGLDRVTGRPIKNKASVP